MDANTQSSTAEDFSSTEKFSYIDYSRVPHDVNPGARPRSGESGSYDSMRKRGPSEAFIFPTKLYKILANSEFSHIVTWLPHGRSWRVIDRQAFMEEIMSKCFAQTKYQSFIRQVNGWGFRRITQGQDQDSYYHCLFLRTKKHLIKFMTRHHVAKRRSNPEPNLYVYPSLPSNTASHIQDPIAQPGKKAAISYRSTQQGMVVHNASPPFDGRNRNVLMTCSSAAPSSTVAIRNGSQANPTNHDSNAGTQSHSTSSHQENYDCYRHNLQSQYNLDRRSHSGIEPSTFVLSSGAGFSSSASLLAAAHDYRRKSNSFYNHDGILCLGYDNETVFPNRASSDGQVSHQRSSSQEHHQITTLENEAENNGYHEDNRANSANGNGLNTYHLAQQKEAQCEMQRQHAWQCEQHPSQVSSAVAIDSQKEEHELANQPNLPFHTRSGSSHRPATPPCDCWDQELAATLLCQLEEDNDKIEY